MKSFPYSFLTLILIVITHQQHHQCYCFVLLPTTTIKNPLLSHHHLTNTNFFEKDNDNPIQIFDNAFSSFACEELSYLADDHSSRGNDGSSVFTRPLNNNENSESSVILTPIEHAIDSFLTSIGDTTSKVEYWSRDEYINIQAHADIDEEQLEDTNSIRCPQMGHVLYLQVKDELRGPTCVFPTKQKGWSPEQKQKQHEDGGDSNGEKEHEIVDLVVVPAIEGRVLRFPGNAMHSVPCPANKWLTFNNNDDIEKEEKQEQKHDQFELEPYTEEFDEFDDEYDEFDDDEIERSVLLFNTWPDNEPGPKGVNADYMTGSLPEGIELSEEDALSFFQTEEAKRLSEWEEEYGVNAEKIHCNDRNEWQEIQIETIRNDDINKEIHGQIRIGLMGNANRRLNEDKFVTLYGPTHILEKALTDESQPTLIKLYGK